jgi:hypothetical protein
MTAIHQNSIAGHNAIDDAAQAGNNNARQGVDKRTHNPNLSSVNISYNAELRLRAYQEQRMMRMDPSLLNKESIDVLSKQNILKDSTSNYSKQDALTLQREAEKIRDIPHDARLNDLLHDKYLNEESSNLPKRIELMLSEVENNIINTSDPGYQYLVNVLNKNADRVENPGQLQEIMRKEQFFLTRRKPFMDSSDFQSYSQVLGQFAHIAERQQLTNEFF